MLRIYSTFLILLSMAGCSDQTQQATDTVKTEFDKKQAEFDKNIAEQEILNRPHFDIPAVDYTIPVPKVNLQDDQEIITAVGLPVLEKENSTNQNGEPMTTYYFSDDLRNGLELGLSREFIDVAWKYDQDKPEIAVAVFENGQRITRALLGGEIGGALYTSMIKGSELDAVSFENGIEVNHARCGKNICQFQVIR